MPVLVYRCAHCRREVLVRKPGPLSDEEIARRVREETRPQAPGRRGYRDIGERLRDDIWVGISGTRDYVPRERIPERCPACGRDTWVEARELD